MRRLRISLASSRHQYEIKVGTDILSSLGSNARDWLGKNTRRVAVISNKTVLNLYGKAVIESLESSGFTTSTFLVAEGETAKSLATIQKTLEALSTQKFERADSVVALGGGVIGDLAGFTAAIYMRGIPFIQVPTTLLAQIDSSVGGKTGVNLQSGKNLVGAFHQPVGVLTDVGTLRSLPRRELASGLFECVKQGAISGAPLFGMTSKFLTEFRQNGIVGASSTLEKLVTAHCKFKSTIIKGDERENRSRTDSRSRRILNFGHTAGHALEAGTGYRRIRHGEAVGIGMLVAGQLSKDLGMLAPTELESLSKAVLTCGPLPPTNDLDENEILEVISRDKKGDAGSINWVLLEGIGKPKIVSGKEIAPRILRQSLRRALKIGTK